MSQVNNQGFKIKRVDRFKYYRVIEFLQLPYKDIGKYVCVPWSWVRRRETDKRVLVSYPVENPSDTERRVMKRQRPSDGWKFFMAVEKHDADLYEDAQTFIKDKIKALHKENKKHSDTKNGDVKDDKLSAKSKEKSHKSKLNANPSHKTNVSQEFIATSRNDDKPPLKIKLKRVASTNSDEKTNKKRSKDIEPIISVSEIAQTCQTFECSNENQMLAHRDFPTENSCQQENNHKSIDESVEETGHFERTLQLEKVLTIEKNGDKNSSNVTNLSSEPKTITEKVFFNDFLMLLKDLHESFVDTKSIINNLRKSFVQNSEAMKKVLESVGDCHSSGKISTASSSKDTAEVNNII